MYECKNCGAISYNQNDAHFGYCARCKHWREEPNPENSEHTNMILALRSKLGEALMPVIEGKRRIDAEYALAIFFAEVLAQNNTKEACVDKILAWMGLAIKIAEQECKP